MPLWTSQPQSNRINAPAQDAVAVTPHDTTLLTTPARSLYIGVSGAVKVTTMAGNDVTFANVPVGIFPVSAKRVFSTGTTATNIVALL